MAFLTISGISKKIAGHSILTDINFSQKAFQRIAIAGETGSGKSTLLKIIAGLAQPDAGDVLFGSQKVLGPDQRLVPGHVGISYLSQSFELPHFLRVIQVLTYANTLPEESARKIFNICRIDHLLEHNTSALSGGEMQRIALARALVSSPRLLLLDEPFSNLDSTHKNILKNVIEDIGRQLKISCIMVSHDPVDVLSWADNVIVLRRGAIVQNGTPREVYTAPVDEYVAGLFGPYNMLTPRLMKLFGKQLSEASTKTKFIIRPEKFRIVNKGKNIVQGRIKRVSFCGSYNEVEISLSSARIIWFANSAFRGQRDDLVNLTFSQEDIIMLNLPTVRA